MSRRVSWRARRSRTRMMLQQLLTIQRRPIRWQRKHMYHSSPTSTSSRLCSLALTRSNLIGAALKPLQEIKAPDIEEMPKDEKRDTVIAFQKEIHFHLPNLLATIYNARLQPNSLTPLLNATREMGDTIERLQWITNVDQAIDESLHNHIAEICKHAQDNAKIEDHLEMACFAVKYGCRTLKNISEGLGSWPMIDNAVSSIHTEVPDRDELEQLWAEGKKWMEEQKRKEMKKDAASA